MAKRLFLLTIFSLIGIISAPSTLMAADNFDVKEPEFNAVETVEIVEEPVEITPVTAPEVVAVVAAPRPAPVAPVYTAPRNNIAIAGRTLEVVDVADTMVDSGNHVNRYNGVFYYGHNSGAVFGGLVNVREGAVFSITNNGVTTNYRVAKTVIYEKNVSTGQLQLNGSGSYMKAVSKARNEGVQYSISLMTCYGTSYGNGDASHRLVLFANAI